MSCIKLLFSLLTASFVLYTFYWCAYYRSIILNGFNNETGADRFIVPNIIHFIRFNQTEYSLIDYVVIKAAMRNHRPDFFYIHTDVVGSGNFTGRYWELIKKDKKLWSKIQMFHLEAPREIFGQQLNEGCCLAKR